MFVVITIRLHFDRIIPLCYSIDSMKKRGQPMDAIYSNYHPILLYVDRYSFSEEWVYKEDRVPYGLLRYIISGSACFEVNGTKYEVKKDDVFYSPINCRFSCEAHERITFISARFIGSVQLPGMDMLLQLWGIGQVYNFASQPEMRQWFELLLQSAVSGTNYRKLETISYLNLICANLAKKASSPQRAEYTSEEYLNRFDLESLRYRAEASLIYHDPRIRVLVDFLSLNPKSNLSREEMCEMCGVSESTLRRLFKEQTGKTIHEFLNQNRMAYAAKRLLITNESISSIGYELGFESTSYFGKTFRETYGVSPQQYRKKSQEM